MLLMLEVCELEDSFMPGFSGNNRARWVSCPGQGGSRRAQLSTSILCLQRAAGSFPPCCTGRTQAAQKGTSGVSSSPGTKPPSSLHFSFHPFCLVLSPTERSEAPNCTIQIIPNTVIRNNLIKILIATLKCFLWNYHSCQYPIINVRKSDYLFNKNREIPAFKLVIVANQNAMIMHDNFGLQL